MIETYASYLQSYFDEIDDLKEELIEETIRITEIPAPPFQEKIRAEYLADKFRDIGLTVEVDKVGNVIATLPENMVKNKELPGIMIAAHIDTVFGEEVAIKVKREGDKLYGPGVGDDVRGLVNILQLARIFIRIGADREIYFIANIAEEGLGDLKGSKYLFNDEEHQNKFPIKAFITIDGAGNENVIIKSIGSKRYRIHYTADGGHSYGAFGLPNPGFALGNFLHHMSKLEVPTEPRTTYSVGVISGGTSINSIPFHVYAEIDLRSADDEELDKLDRKIREMAENALVEIRETSNGRIELEMEAIGNRPAGEITEEHELAQLASRVNTYFNIHTNFTASSTDANVPHSKNIPAICISGNDISGRAHSLDEWLDAGESSLLTIKRNLTLLYILSMND